MDEAARRELARRWASRTAAERASARVMAALADELAAHGVPSDVVAAVRAAADDEARHGDLCDGVVAQLGGPTGQAGDDLGLPPTASTHPVAATAERVIYLLCAGEQVAAASLDATAAGASAPGIADLLRRIAADEQRHGQLGWRVLDALVGRLDPTTRGALATHAPRQALRAVIAAEAGAALGVDTELARAWGVAAAPDSRARGLRVVATHVAPALHARGLWSDPPTP